MTVKYRGKSSGSGERMRLFCLIILCLLFNATILIASEDEEAEEPSFWDMFVDPEDGAIDLSQWFDSPTGFLPIPLVVTEPAIG